MTADDLHRLEQLGANATAGPWYVSRLDDEMCMGAIAITTEPRVSTSRTPSMRAGDWPGEKVVAACLIQSPPYVIPDDDRFDENAALISELRNALPELLRLARMGLKAER